MGKKNDKFSAFLNRADKLADLFNGCLYYGIPVINPEQLAEIQRIYHEAIQDRYGKKRKMRKERDVAKALIRAGGIVILAVELQDNINFCMPIRCVEYDLEELLKQIRRLKEKYKREGGLKPGAEYLSGIKENDKLNPVITLVVYHGPGKWNSAESVSGMLNQGGMDPVLSKYILDHNIHVINLSELDENLFQTELRELIGLMKRKDDKEAMRIFYQENEERFSNMDEEAYELICTMLNLRPLLRQKENFRKGKDGKLDMCKAFDELMKDSKDEGIRIGVKRGVKQGEERLSNLLEKMLKDGRDSEIGLVISNMTKRRRLYKEYGL